VIIKNADPAVGTEIDDLIVQLGDPAWSKREEASQSLLKMGAAAVPKLQEATKNKDLEVVWRAEKLVAQLKTGPPQPN
jgi:HEAT repeat protein